MRSMQVEELQRRIVEEFDSPVTQQAYMKHAAEGLWRGEEQLIKEYFKLPARILDTGCGTGRTTLVLDDKGQVSQYRTKLNVSFKFEGT